MTKTIKICTGNECSQKGSQNLFDKISRENPDKKIETCGCQDNCQNGITVIVSSPEKYKEVHSKMDENKIKKIL